MQKITQLKISPAKCSLKVKIAIGFALELWHLRLSKEIQRLGKLNFNCA